MGTAHELSSEHLEAQLPATNHRQPIHQITQSNQIIPSIKSHNQSNHIINQITQFINSPNESNHIIHQITQSIKSQNPSNHPINQIANSVKSLNESNHPMNRITQSITCTAPFPSASAELRSFINRLIIIIINQIT